MIIGADTYSEPNYRVTDMGKSININNNTEEKVLFILDYSSSMTEEIAGSQKVFMMLNTIRQILPMINPKLHVGLRVYGHRMGITQFDACKASSLLVPIHSGSGKIISQKLSKVRPRGMTPITYSLKKAVESDFLGYSGKKHIILLTDGGENCDESPCVWAMDLVTKRKDVVIDVIAFNINKSDDLDQLKCSALVTSGKFYSANTTAQLVNSISDSLNIKKDVDAKIIFNNK